MPCPPGAADYGGGVGIRPRSILVLLASGLLLGLGNAPPAFGHEDAPSGFRSTVEAVRPPLPGLQVRVLGGDDQLQLVNESDVEVIVLGYQGEPYLRFSADGVYENRSSPAVYLNRDRLAAGSVPAEADADAAPRWVRASEGSGFSWHDSRIQWTSRTLPPAVQEAPGEPHRILAWRVPAQADGRPLQITGTLLYLPGGGGGPRWWLLGVLVGLAALAGAAAFVLYLRRPAPP